MAKISLKFTNRHNRFCLVATVVGTTTRHYRVIEELSDPNYAHWDKKSQRFVSRSPKDAENNRILDGILQKYQALLDARDFENGKQLFAYEESKNPISIKPARVIKKSFPAPQSKQAQGPTMREWLNQVINDIKNPTRLKPSASYQGYLTLLHALEQEGTLVDKPLKEFSDDSFVSFIKWIKKRKPKKGCGNNFFGLMKIFTATLNRARKARLIDYQPNFPYMDYAPIHKITDKASEFLTNGGAIKSLSPEQYEAFKVLDVDTVISGRSAQTFYHKNMYRDFCILMYEMKSRPIDILRLHWDNIALDPSTGRYTCTYIPAKKKNYGASSKHTSKALVIQYLTEDAVKIIMKYKGQSKGGYVFPFPMNNLRWNLDDPMDFHRNYYLANGVCGRINKFLHKVGELFGLTYQLTLYAFRRTAITQAVTDNKMPIAMIAKIAGTSVEMIEAHYANYLHALASYQ